MNPSNFEGLDDYRFMLYEKDGSLSEIIPIRNLKLYYEWDAPTKEHKLLSGLAVMFLILVNIRRW